MAASCGPPFFCGSFFFAERALYRRVWGYYIGRNGQSFLFLKVVPCEGDTAIRNYANWYARCRECAKV